MGSLPLAYVVVGRQFSSDGETSDDDSSYSSQQLLHAIEDGDLAEVRCLVEVHHVDDHSGPLHLASWHGHLDIVRYLVEERNCDLECRNEYESTLSI